MRSSDQAPAKGAPEGRETGVRGERGMPMIARALSMQSRLSNLLAMALMLTIGVAFLAWYYLHMPTRPARVRQAAQASLAGRAEGEMSLPSLGPLPLPALGLGQPQDANTEPSPAAATAAIVEHSGSSQSSDQPPKPTALDRRLSGVAFATGGAAGSGGSGVAAAVSASEASLTSHATASTMPSQDPLSELLQGDSPHLARARVLPTQRLLLPKGAFLDCTLETAIDSTLPGLTSCVTATDTFGADGTVVLLERGTKLMGETRGQVQQGSSRIFVLWTEARTPSGVIVPLDSPGADELGRSGLPGEVDRHFLERFGAAILISTLNGGVQAAIQASNKGNGTVIYNPSGPQDVLGEVLKSTVNIPPTVVKHNGDRIQVLVARDVDFSSVYELRHAIARP